MKTVLTILASVSLFASTVSAHPDCETSRRIVGYTHFGTPIIATYDIIGRSRCGDPVFGWVTHYPEERGFTLSFHDRDGDRRHHDWDRDRDRDHDRDHDDHHHSRR